MARNVAIRYRRFMNTPLSIDAAAALLAEQNYVADRQLATAVFLALKLKRPLFLEGEPGTGKTEIAKVLAAGLAAELIRLQCYEGLDVNAAAYERGRCWRSGWPRPRRPPASSSPRGCSPAAS